MKRDETGSIVIGRQYQNHNPRPGPVYAGGGYTPIVNSLRTSSEEDTLRLLRKFPDLVNEISTGGATPLHMCGMGRDNQRRTSLIVEMGGDVEALDTYGMTPLHRMASNNLAIGAAALLDAGADPAFEGLVHRTPLDIAKRSDARDVVALLERRNKMRTDVVVSSLRVVSSQARDERIDGTYVRRDGRKTIPDGFAKVCDANDWDTDETWRKLSASGAWFERVSSSVEESKDATSSANTSSSSSLSSAYVYYNHADRHWWIDGPSGHGVWKAPGRAHTPPGNGWISLSPSSKASPPTMLIFRSVLKRLVK